MFAYRLALKLGIVDVAGMLASMSARQLLGWLGYYSIEPWGLTDAAIYAMAGTDKRRKETTAQGIEAMLRAMHKASSG